MNPAAVAECHHPEPKKIPLLTAGEITLVVMREWEMACLDFFAMNKKLDVADWVEAILPGIKDLQACDWVVTHCVRLTLLSFEDFMTEVHREFLPDNWDNDLRSRICSSRLKPSDNFSSWVHNLRHLNLILQGNDYHLNDDALRMQLDCLIDSDLHIHAKN